MKRKRKTQLNTLRHQMEKARAKAGQPGNIKDSHLASYLRGWNAADKRFEQQRRRVG